MGLLLCTGESCQCAVPVLGWLLPIPSILLHHVLHHDDKRLTYSEKLVKKWRITVLRAFNLRTRQLLSIAGRARMFSHMGGTTKWVMTTCFSSWRASQPHPGCFPDASLFLLTLPDPMASTQQSLCCCRSGTLRQHIIFVRNHCYLALQSHISLISVILHHDLHLWKPWVKHGLFVVTPWHLVAISGGRQAIKSICEGESSFSLSETEPETMYQCPYIFNSEDWLTICLAEV